jgi:hypothetical protein
MGFIVIHGGPDMSFFSIFWNAWTKTVIGISSLSTWPRSVIFG